MKRPHRRTHLLIWAIFAPVAAIVSVLAWMQRPGTPLSELPAGIEEISNDEGAQ